MFNNKMNTVHSTNCKYGYQYPSARQTQNAAAEPPFQRLSEPGIG
jgi:hypothetical protein